MRNQKGITMISLVIYIVAFSIIIGIVGAVTTFFSNNVSGLNESAGKNAEYNKFNIYMSEYTKNGYEVTFGTYGENSNPYIMFEKDGDKIVFEKVDDILYMDNVKLCDKVDSLETKLETAENGSQVLKIKIQINGTVYTNDYVLENNQVSSTESEIDNSESLVLGLVDDLGTRSTIYLYNNTDKITSGTITLTMPDGTTQNITALDNTTTISNTANYVTYTVSKNGTYEFQAKAADVETVTKIEVKNIEQFTDVSTLGLSYAKNEQKAYNYQGAAVPKGYYVDTKSKVNTGLVITDAIDSEGYSTGNEWVWVPVNETIGNSDFYYEENGTFVGTENATYSMYSKLWNYTTDINTIINTKVLLEKATPNSFDGYSEPVITSYENSVDGDDLNYGLIKKRSTTEYFSNVTGVAEQYIKDYKKMVSSIEKYGGFYIGRYEITNSGVKKGDSIVDENWYYFYNLLMDLDNESSNVETSMIYGVIWDMTMDWINKTNINLPIGYNGENTNGFGNYKNSEVFVRGEKANIVLIQTNDKVKLETGQASYTRINNIYDLSGNCWDWTQEVWGKRYRCIRGGCYASADNRYTYMSSRNFVGAITNSYKYLCSSRPQLYIE